MDYMAASRRFSMEKHLKELMGLDLFVAIGINQKEIIAVEKINIPRKAQYRRDSESLQIDYISNLKGLAYLLGMGLKPAGVSESTFQSFKLLIEDLVKRGNLKETILDHFNEEK